MYSFLQMQFILDEDYFKIFVLSGVIDIKTGNEKQLAA